MRLKLVFFLLALAVTLHIKATNSFELNHSAFKVIVELQNLDSLNQSSINTNAVIGVKLKRGKAILFTIFTGFLGGHRIYFGTHHRTPIIYSITFGGLGILPLIDLVHIIFTKDLSRYEHKTQIIMWGK